MIRVVRKPEIISHFLNYLGFVGSADPEEFHGFLIRHDQKVYWDDYRDFAINLGFVFEKVYKDTCYYIPTNLGRSLEQGKFEPDAILHLVPQYRRYCSEIFRIMNRTKESIDRNEVYANIDLASNTFTSPTFKKKDQDHNFNRYRLWDQQLGIRDRGRQDIYFSKKIEQLLMTVADKPVKLNTAYFTNDLYSIPQNQLPLMTFLLILIIADHNGVEVQEQELGHFMQQKHRKFSKKSLTTIIEYLNRVGIPLNRSDGILAFRTPIIISSSIDHISSTLKSILNRKWNLSSWNDVFRKLYTKFYDFDIYGSTCTKYGSKWIVNTEIEFEYIPRFNPDVSQGPFECIKHEGRFGINNSVSVANIFGFGLHYTEFRIHEIIKNVFDTIENSSYLLLSDLIYPEQLFGIISCLYSPFVLGPIPLVEHDKMGLVLTKLGLTLHEMKGSMFHRGLVTVMYYTNPHILVSCELVRHDRINVESIGNSWQIIFGDTTSNFLKTVDAVLEKMGFQVLKGYYQNDLESKEKVEYNLINTLLHLGVVELKSGGRVERSHWFHDLSQSKKGDMFYRGKELRKKLPPILEELRVT